LVARDNGTTDPLGGALCLVHRYETRHHTDTETSKDTTDDKERDLHGCCLHGDTNSEDEACGDDAQSSTEIICHGGSEESTEEGAS